MLCDGGKDEYGQWQKKPCKICKELLPLESFYQRKFLTPSNVCIKCSLEKNKKRIINDSDFREKKRLYLKDYYKLNKEKLLKQQKDARTNK